MRSLALMLLCALAPVTAHAADGLQSINIHADCDGNVTSAVVASFTEAIRGSQKYHLVPNFSDEGRQGIVMTVHMACAEMHNVVGIATSYGWAKCYSEKECHIALDGRSIRAVLCDESASAECGRTLFKALEDFFKNADPSTFSL
jgi:hypothetical protein